MIKYEDFINDALQKRGYHDNYNHKVTGFEIHHILPRCLGGADISSNMVLLTAGEHLLAHSLLVKENPGNAKLYTALYHMSYEIGVESLLEIIDDKVEFEKVVGTIMKVRSERNISGDKNPMYHKHHTEETKKVMSEKKKGRYIGKDNPHWGKHHSEETKQKLSADRQGADNWRSQKVYCPELDMTFDTVADASKYVGIKNGITYCCRHQYNRETAGRHPITHEKLHWVYVNEKIFGN